MTYRNFPKHTRLIEGHSRVYCVPTQFTLEHGSHAQRRFVERELRRQAAKSQSRRDGGR